MKDNQQFKTRSGVTAGDWCIIFNDDTPSNGIWSKRCGFNSKFAATQYGLTRYDPDSYKIRRNNGRPG